MTCFSWLGFRSSWVYTGSTHTLNTDTWIIFLAGWFVRLIYSFEHVFYVCFIYIPLLWYFFDLCRVMKLAILYCFLCGLDVMVHTLSMFLQLIQFYAKKHFFTAPLGVKRLTLVIAMSFYRDVNASDFEQFIECLNLFVFLFTSNLQFYCVTFYGKLAVRFCSLYLSHLGNLITDFPVSLFTI